MKSRLAVALVFPGILLCGAGCMNRGPARVKPPGIDPSAAGSGAMTKYDTNGDGVVKGDELAAAPSLKAALKNLDTDGDGGVSAGEVAARVRSWQESKLGKQSVQVIVRRNGQPVEGATVRLVPEEFLGSEIQPCEGTTNKKGVASPSAVGDELPGCAPGLYRVEITAADGSIGPKYNTETTLGQEVAVDAAGLQEGVRIEVD